MVNKILIADDEPDVLAILEKKLKENYFEVLGLSKGKDILDSVKSFKPDLMILDIVMPDIDGYSVAFLLREDKELKGIPIIFMTGKDLDYSGVQRRIAELGYCDFISKPCSFEDLFKKIKEIVG
jgi:DNA-binding response OmpR family regulator